MLSLRSILSLLNEPLNDSFYPNKMLRKLSMTGGALAPHHNRRPQEARPHAFQKRISNDTRVASSLRLAAAPCSK